MIFPGVPLLSKLLRDQLQVVRTGEPDSNPQLGKTATDCKQGCSGHFIRAIESYRVQSELELLTIILVDTEKALGDDFPMRVD
jgi:hypothetical protein